MDKSLVSRPQVWLSGTDCSLEEFRDTVEQVTDRETCPLADDIQKNIPIYDAGRIRTALDDDAAIRAYMAEWNDVFLDGPGVVVFRRTYPDLALIDAVSGVLVGLIEEERRNQSGRGDHFAKAGANARVWNAHEKLCLAAPELFIRYNANDILALVSRSWLGPLYQITAQVNLVYPGGIAQTPHRDYHMGFQTAETLSAYPAIVHRLSAALTLQGAIAHCDMPLESGPTKLLPYSQRYLPGYFATLLPEFRAYFEEHYAQLPLEKGDTLFFNPALFHAGGSNTSKDIHRLANLLQIGSGYGRSIEIVGRARMSKKVLPALSALKRSNGLDARAIANVIAATAEGYPFPADLDIDSPLTDMAPPSQQDIMHEALAQGWTPKAFNAAIDAYEERRAQRRFV